MSGAVLETSKRSTERSGFSGPRSTPRGKWARDFMAWRRADIEMPTSQSTSSSSSGTSSTRTSFSPESSASTRKESLSSALATTSVLQATVTTNIPTTSSSVSEIVPIFNGPIYSSVAGVFSSVEPSSTASSNSAASSTIGSYPSTTRPVIIYGPGLSSAGSDSGASTEISTTTSSISATTSSSARTFSLTLFPPQFPTPHSSASSLSSVGSSSFSSPNNNGPSGSASLSIPKADPSGSTAASMESSAAGVHTAAPVALPSGASLTLGPSGFGQEPSNTILLSVFFPTDSASATTIGTNGTSDSMTPASATSGSRTFSHNTGAIIGVAFGATIALVLGVFFTLIACRRSKSVPKRKVGGLWISPPLLQDDGMDDAYSPVTRMRSRRPSPSFIRPASFPSLDMTSPTGQEMPVDGLESDAHYDTDTWGGADFAPVPPPPVLVSPSSMSALSPEFYSGASPSIPSGPPPQTAAQPSPVNAKGFMRRLRRGRPSMASRGLLTTLAPVLEGPTPATSVAEMSRPPSSLTLASRPTPTFGEVLNDFPSVPEASPVQSPQNFALPWIHRTRATQATEPAGWTPPATWAI
ncbi:hypothetical protein C8R47DRAFT_1156732 [Mycena vitilis]|nr:hypothetical protein C8R47DRAFT_1156732 [Mycena vitilis]